MASDVQVAITHAVPQDTVSGRCFLSLLYGNWAKQNPVPCSPLLVLPGAILPAPGHGSQAVKPRLGGKLGCPSHSLPISVICTSSTGNSSRKKVILETA